MQSITRPRRSPIRARHPPVTHTDYLTAVNLVDDFYRQNQRAAHPQAAPRHTYRWLESVLRRHPDPGQLRVEHVKSHTDATDVQSKLNSRADRAAKDARDTSPSFAVPIDFADKFLAHVQ